MSVATTLPAIPVALPMLGAALLAALRKWMSRTVADSLGILISGATLVVCGILLAHCSLHGASTYWFGNWYPRGSMVLGIAFVVEPIGVGLATLAALLTFLSLIFSWRFIDAGGKHLQPLMLIFLAAMCGFSMTTDLFNLFVFFELMSTAAFALCGLKTAEPAPLQGSFNFAVTNTVAAFLVLTGIAMLYAMTGALNMAQIGLSLGGRHDQTVLFAFTLLTCGFLIKGAIAPFHLWLPDAHAVAPTPVCVLFSGIMVELGIYAVVKIHSVIFSGSLGPHENAVRGILLAFGAATVLLGGVMCYAEHHLKRLLAFSTVSHAGLMLVAYAIRGPLAIAAMLTYLLAHAFVKSSLFFVAGIVLHRLRSISERALFGKGRKLVFAGLMWVLGGAGLAACPPFLTMVGDAGADHAAELAGVHGISILFLISGVLTCAAVFRSGIRIFLGWGDEPITDQAAEIGELPETKEEEREVLACHSIPPAVCLVAALGLTFTPGWLSVLRNAAAALASQPAFLHMVYTGQAVAVTLAPWREAIAGSAMRGVLAVVLALALALTSVFRSRIARALRLGAFMERGVPALRAMQSGHPGDYVAWLTVGLAAFGSAAMVLLRR